MSPEAAEHRAGHHFGVLLLDSAHSHAQVLGLEHDSDPKSVEFLHHSGGDLRGHALLHLQTPGVDLDQARQLREADDVVLGDIGDLRLPEERQQVVLTEREEVDVAAKDHLGVVLDEERPVDDALGILMIAASEVLEGPSDSSRSFDQAFPVWILPDLLEDGAYVWLDRRETSRSQGADSPLAAAQYL